jgi:hypothetical protein
MPLSFVNSAFTPAKPSFRTLDTFANPAEEGETSEMSFTVQTSVGGDVPNTDLVSATLTVYDEETHVVVNGRQDQDILGVASLGDNDVVISVISEFVWSMQALDTPVVDPTNTKKIEYHRAIFTIETATEVCIHQVRFPIRRAFRPVTDEE